MSVARCLKPQFLQYSVALRQFSACSVVKKGQLTRAKVTEP